MTVSFRMQPCKTKRHAIDYAYTWTSFVTLPYSPSTVIDTLVDPVHVVSTESKCLEDACM